MKFRLISIGLALALILGFTGCGEGGTTRPTRAAHFNTSTTPDGTGVIIDRYTSNTRDIIIPATFGGLPVKILGPQSFSRVGALFSIIVPEGVVEIQGDMGPANTAAFFGCNRLAEIRLPSTLEVIGDGVFHRTSQLQTITLPPNIRSIGHSVFSASGITTMPEWPRAVTYIPDETFRTAAIRGELVIPEGIQRVGRFAFEMNNNITSISLPSTIRYIDEGAFQRINALTTVTVHPSVTSIEFGGVVFDGCPNISEESKALLLSLGYESESW
ncbi:MAG: leucine-rich repeat domain-containing protein [Treponema sp.]|nr:leucine-rich repeat domain-containing protein [Treponema sp.]